MPRLNAARPMMLLGLLVMMAESGQLARGQGNGRAGREAFLNRRNDDAGIKSPAPNQVIQRDDRGLADIPIVLDDDRKGDKIEVASVQGSLGGPNYRFVDGAIRGVPAGGPYTIVGTIKSEKGEESAFQIDQVYVGDLWVLAGQSNMQGVGDLSVDRGSSSKVLLLDMGGDWRFAIDPLHELEASPDPVHSGDPETSEERLDKERKNRTKGAGLGIPFAQAMVGSTGVPVGLVACAHGGTSMAQWSPAKKGEGGKSLYGSMIRQVNLAGGKVKGVLWYQGESDAMSPGGPAAFPKVFADFIKAVRDDFGQPDLPFYYVQIGRYVREGDGKDWNSIQDAQRRLVETVPNTAVVAAVDLPLDDPIHVGTAGLRRLGERLAKVALRHQFGLPGASTPTFERVTKGPNNTLVVKFKGVNRSHLGANQLGSQLTGLRPDRHVAGFSIRQGDEKDAHLIYEARVGATGDVVILRLASTPPPGATLSYGRGLDPYCNLVDSLDMAVPVFGPIALDGIK